MKKTVVIVMLLTIVTKVVGFSREIILTYYYGASSISDAYLISLTIPAVIFSFIGIGIQTIFIPIYSKYRNEKGKKEANKLTNNVVNMLLVITALIVVLILIFTTPIVKLFANGLDGATLATAVSFTRITGISLFFVGLVYVFQGYLQVEKNFTIPALVGLPLNIAYILSIILSSMFGVALLPYGKVIGVLAQFLLLLPFIVKKGYTHSLFLKYDENIKKILYLTLPITFGESINQINMIIDKTLASQLAVGGISALNYANRLNLFIQGIFVLSIASVLYPTISRMATDKNILGYKKTVIESISAINLFVIPITFGAMIFSLQIVDFLFGRGAFDIQAQEMTSSALFYYSIGMVAIGIREILSRAFYSLEDTKTPMINAVIGMSINVILNIILSKVMGISGLALATSLSAFVTTVLLFVSLRRKIGAFGIKGLIITSIKILTSSTIMAIASKWGFNILNEYMGATGSLIIAILLGVLVYFTAITFMRIKEVDIIVHSIKSRVFSRRIK